MPFLAIEEAAPRVLKGVGETIHIDDFTPSYGVSPKYRGCFVRWRVKSGNTPTLDTIKLGNNTGWNDVETVGTDNYNNKPFGIIDSYPERVNDVDGGGIRGKLTVHVLGGRAPVLVAFRYIDSGGHIAQVPGNLVGKRVWVYGHDVDVGANVYRVAVVSDVTVTGEPSFTVENVIQPLPLVKNMPSQPRDNGWVVVALDSGFLVDGAIAP